MSASQRPWHNKALQRDAQKHYDRLANLGLLDNVDKCVAEADDESVDIASSMIRLLQSEKKRQGASKKHKCQSLVESRAFDHDPVVHSDSLTALANDAVSRFGLTVGDILKMKPGQQMRVWMLDRNIGEGFGSKTRGDKINVARALDEDRLTTGRYTHKKGLEGTMQFENGNLHDPFVWEVNLAAIEPDGNLFWGPINGDCGCSPDPTRAIDIKTLDPKLKVGWRGPAIDLAHVQELPKTFTYYNDALNDYVPYLFRDLTDY